MEASCTSYKNTGFFSPTVIDYLENRADLKPFYSYRPDMADFAELLKNKKVVADREILHRVLSKQYGIESGSLEVGKSGSDEANVELTTYNVQPLVTQNLQLLKLNNTYTITTGHQLNIFAGPLYFLYKIATAIKLAQQLKAAHPDKNFVPVYWMASEDHDFAEINYTNIGGKKVHWWYEASGATGRINPDTMRQALNQYKGVLGMEGHSKELAEIVETAYTRFDKLADATRYLVNALFGQYGLVIIDADDHEFKQQFAPIMEQDIINQNSFKNITATNEQLQKLGVHIQVNPREINFFYLKDQLRERIVFEQDSYQVMNTEIRFTEAELKQEIATSPERFSPNVVMRPLYQECILPNIAYIGGGAEVVYWLELKSNFDFYKVDFPILILRNSALVVRKEQAAKIERMDLNVAALFKQTDALQTEWIKKHSDHNLSLEGEWRELTAVFEKIKLRSYKIDPTLSSSAAAVQARLKHAVDNLEKKLIRAEKRNYDVRLEQLSTVKAELFPKDSLQERTENFGLMYVKWGQSFVEELIRHFEPLDFVFTILTE
ncbi:bacillithiol biosynthesis cysteine-adding enzyme BshC [Mucilaginibacter sp. OK268]|uniref:bacillithiol biosynthesis cysteine-adding enzyme BshC n=1 Tax=Mucilaginibacter sp. OK268 TaxID=1881048 RepID=UPI000B89883B|nr:bacillithiol biosynthesis cysteine-adding enzyme BshC [Mucilaginibacter sp. OK268]